jgi:membrane protein
VFLQFRGLVGADGAAAIQALVESARRPTEGRFATLTAIVVMLIGATGVFAELQSAMDRIWKAPLSDKHPAFLYFIQRRLWTFGMVMAVAFLSLVSLIVSACLSACIPSGALTSDMSSCCCRR